MRIHMLSAVALSALLATGGVATAQTGGDPQPVDPSKFSLVQTEIVISDAAGTELKTLSCEWREPEDDDRPCLRFQGDPQTAFAAIEDAGGVRADQHTTTEKGMDVRTTYSKRADGTWLIRGKGTIGRPVHFGRVCTADGQKCVMWDAEGAKSAVKSVKAAAAKLRQKR